MLRMQAVRLRDASDRVRPERQRRARPTIVEMLADESRAVAGRPAARPLIRPVAQPLGLHAGRRRAARSRRRCWRCSRCAVARIDLRTHRGVHPRIGAVDVVPFVPLGARPWPTAWRSRRRSAGRSPSGSACRCSCTKRRRARPARRSLEDIRRGEFEGLAAKMTRAGLGAGLRPVAPHPTAGATVIGARMPLIAYNINLATDRLDVAKTDRRGRPREQRRLAASSRRSGSRCAHRGIVQVSMNLTDFEKTPISAVFEAVEREAERTRRRRPGERDRRADSGRGARRHDAEHLRLRGFTDDADSRANGCATDRL